jgi:PIN domain nuclease of toxin-antitoxin system
MANSGALSAAAKATIAAGPNTLSVVSYWEVMIKSMKGTLDVGDPRVWWRDALEQLAATALPLRADHVAALSGLLAIHKDPIDRMLIAQAMTEGLALVTADKRIALYAAAGLRVVR